MFDLIDPDQVGAPDYPSGPGIGPGGSDLRPGAEPSGCAGKTRIEQGMRKAEQTLRQFERGNGFGVEKNRVRVVVIISDGQFCSRDLAQSVRVLDKKLRVLALAAGRGANHRKLRGLVSDRNYVLTLRHLDTKELLRIYGDATLANPIPVFDPVTMTRLKVRETLTDTMELVPGSLNPVPASIVGQTIEWVLPMPQTPISVSFRVRSKVAGVFPVASTSRAELDDTLGRSGAGDFPAVTVERRP